jgi:hypothetical protein
MHQRTQTGMTESPFDPNANAPYESQIPQLPVEPMASTDADLLTEASGKVLVETADSTGTVEQESLTPNIPDISIADASLAQVLGLLLRYPRRTSAELIRVFDSTNSESAGLASSTREAEAVGANRPEPRASVMSQSSLPAASRPAFRRPARANAPSLDGLSRAINMISASTDAAAVLSPGVIPAAALERDQQPALVLNSSALRAFVPMAAGFLLTVFGIVYGLRNGGQRLTADLFPGPALFMLAGVIIFTLFASRVFPAVRLAPLTRFTPMAVPGRRWSFQTWVKRNWVRLTLIVFGLVFMAGAWSFNGDNQFTPTGVICWLLSILSWVAVFAPEIVPRNFILKLIVRIIRLPGQVISFRLSWTMIALLIIMGVGAYFRFSNLSAFPPEMTSDHVEKILDSLNIAKGATPVFLPNNGGREIVQFYILALMHNWFGLSFDHTLLKLLSGIEGMLGILAAWWLGRTLVGDSDKELGNLTGLVMAALLAISYWQLMLSLLGLRIVLTPLIMTIILIFFVRALRYNRIEDYIKTGLLLGIGLYMYQAVRMVPIVLIVGLLLALVIRARGWRMRGQYVLHFVALVLIATAVFVPLGRYWQQSPNEFWSRTSGRLFGEDLIQTTDPVTGSITSRIATTQDRIDAFKNNISYFGQNMVNSVLMFTWAGDRAWISGEQNGAPELDALTSGLFLIGLGLWLVRMIRRRDPGDWLIPFGLVIMLFPTALSLAFTIEVPSATRASGTIPMVYLLAGFAGALLIRQAWRALQGHVGQALVVIAGVLLLIPAAQSNWWVYFGSSMPQYKLVSQDHREAGQVLKGFEQSTGAPGNAFMISFRYWWDHRALAIEAGDLDWRLNNGIVGDNMMPNLLAAIRANIGTAHEIRPDRQLMFFLNQNDKDNLLSLQNWLPSGTTVERVQTDTPLKDFMILLSPPVGCDWLNQKVGPGMSALCPITNSQILPTPAQ